jgi:hypothetical protein
MNDSLPLPMTFWIETALLAASAIALWVVVFAIKRAQHRRNYHIWQGTAAPARRRPWRRWTA